MKNEKLINGIAVFVLTVLLTLGGIGCLVTGMELEAKLVPVAFGCAVAAAAGVLCGSFRMGWLPPGVVMLLGGWLWAKKLLARSVETLLYLLSVQYNKGYSCGVFYWSETAPNGEITLALCIFGAFVAGLLGWFLIKGWMPVLPGLLALAPVIACLVLTDTVPGERWLFAVLLSLCLMLLTQSARGKEANQPGCLTALLLIPVTVALAMLFLLIPQETYHRQGGAQALEDWVMQWFENPVEETVQEVFAPSGTADERVNLKAVGPKQYQMNIVMEMTAQESGPLYLRGQIYDGYDGLSWSNSGDSDIGKNYLLQSRSLELTVETKRVQPLLYLPYVSYHPLEKGKVENEERLKDYTVTYTPLTQYDESWNSIRMEIPEELNPFLQLPSATKQQAKNFLPEQTDASAGGMWRYAQAVAQVVRDSAKYDLRTQSMPREEADFALWFLEESDTGYCIHFASATAVLLRAAGIPARYVTGYLVSAKAGDTVRVQQKDAHAWVECYIAGIGWQVLEATPADGTSPVPQETTQQTAQNQPVPTEPVDIPQDSQPTQVTQPQIPQPNQSTSPVGGADAPQKSETREMPTWLGTAVWVLLAVAAVPAQWQLRLWLRRRRFARGDTNQRVLVRFREIVRHCRIRRKSPEKEIILLAQRAKFSQHTIMPEELARMDAWLEKSRRDFQRESLWLQPVYTLLLALY